MTKLASPHFFSEVNQASSDPSVQPGPVTFPPMTLSLRLADVTMDNAGVPARVYDVEFCLDWGEGPKMLSRSTYELPATGHRLSVLGMPMLLKPGVGQTEMVVEPLAL